MCIFEFGEGYQEYRSPTLDVVSCFLLPLPKALSCLHIVRRQLIYEFNGHVYVVVLLCGTIMTVLLSMMSFVRRCM